MIFVNSSDAVVDPVNMETLQGVSLRGSDGRRRPMVPGAQQRFESLSRLLQAATMDDNVRAEANAIFLELFSREGFSGDDGRSTFWALQPQQNCSAIIKQAEQRAIVVEYRRASERREVRAKARRHIAASASEQVRSQGLSYILFFLIFMAWAGFGAILAHWLGINLAKSDGDDPADRFFLLYTVVSGLLAFLWDRRRHVK